MNGFTDFIALIIAGSSIAMYIHNKYLLFKSELDKLWEQK